MEYITVLNNNLEYSVDDNHTVNLSFQSTACVSFVLQSQLNAVLAKT